MSYILIGTTTALSSSYNGNVFILEQKTAVNNGIGSVFRVYSTVSGNIKLALYENNAGAPGALIAAMDTGQSVVSGWNNLSFPNPNIVSGNVYWLACIADTTGVLKYTSTGGTAKTKSISYDGFTFPNPAGSGFIDRTYRYSIAIYGEPPPTITDCSDEDIEEGESVDLTGTDLSGTTVTLELGDAATYGACSVKTTQTINSNDGSTINFTAVKGSLDYGTNYLYVTRDGQTSDGYAINLYAELDITSASSSLLTGFPGTVTGAHYGATQGASKLYLCDQADALGTNVEQTITAWSDTSITFTVVKGGLSVGTAYLVVSRNDATLGDTAARLSAGYEVTLADPPTRLNFKHFLENGAGTMAHLWHVAGYPWAVTDSQELVDALSDTGNIMVQLARKRLFGTNEIALVGGTAIPAYDVPIFATLKKDFGKVKFEIDESNGLMKGGSWSVKIEDKDLGHTWAHAVSGDEIFGLEGLHRVANVKASDVHGWGYLRENFVRQATGFEQLEISVEEQSPGYLYDRINGLTTSEYKVLWMNHEAIAVSSIESGTAPEYVIQAAERGLYRSRKQDHYTDALKGLNPIIADVPGDIVGHYCWLYAIPLVNGQLVLTQGNRPLIVEELRGLVSPNMYSNDGITYVSVREDLAALERSVNVEMSRAAETSMKGFFFSRGDSPAGNGGYTYEDNDVRIELKQKMQAPHLIIREFYFSYKMLADTYKDSFSGFDGGELIILRQAAKLDLEAKAIAQSVEHYIWLCPKNSTVYFETVDQVIDALNWELAKLRHGLDGANSENTELKHSWFVANINNRYGLVSTDETEDREYLKNHIAVNDWPTQQALHGYITGPLAWVFALGNTVGNPGTTIYDLIKSTSENDRIKGYSRLETLSPDKSLISIIPWQNAISQTCWMVPVDSKMGNWKEEIEWESRYSNIFNEYLKEFGMEIAKPRYYHGWNWVEHPASWASDFGIALHTNNNWRIFIDSSVDTESFVDGDIIFIGDGKRFPRLTGTIDEVIPLDGYDRTNEVVLDPNFVFSENSALFPHGTSLFYLPLLEVIGNEEVENLDELDPHRLRKSMTIETLQPSLVFRSILGETIGGVNIANEIQVATCPFFTTVEDFVSAIDWASLDYLPRLYGQNYIAPLESGDSVKGILKNELLFHRAHMTREFDSTYLMWRYRFTPIAPINASMALMGGFHLDGNKALTGPPEESHGVGELYNAIALKVGDIETKIQQMNSPIIGTDERRTLKVEPEVSRIPLYDIMNDGSQTEDLVAAFRPLLDAISRPAVIQTKGTTLFQYLFPVGREIRVTDITARRPFTHRLGLDVEPAKVMGASWEWKKCQGTITYSLGNSHSSAQYGYAPACMLEAGNFSKAVGSWSGTANEHEFGDHCKDVYYFDCIDIGDAGNPSSRACTCGDYAVWAIEIGTPGWTPLPFTCSVDLDTDVITLTGEVTDIDEGKTYVIVFRPWADLEPCQKVWVTHADDDNTIGAAALPANRWE